MILKNCELWWCKLHPDYPNDKFSPDNPTWECQIRTTDPEQAEEWREAGLSVKREAPDDGEKYYRANLKKKSKMGGKFEGQPATPVKVVDGKLKDIKPDTVGNGSIANIRLEPYDWSFNGRSGTSLRLEAVQVIHHKVYLPEERDDDEAFEITETTVDESGVNEETASKGVTINTDEDDEF
jgi:hypothetical protein